MKKPFLCSVIIILSCFVGYSQEWKSLRAYKKETGFNTLQNGCWLKKDRKRNTIRWQDANEYNLCVPKGYLKYHCITQIRDFYTFFNDYRMKKGHDIKWFGIASVAANQLANFENSFIRIFIIRNKELNRFAQTGSQKVFAFAFPQLQEIYKSTTAITNTEALNWDQKYGTIEQCEILQPLYNELSEKSIRKLERMAKGKWIFALGVRKKLRFKGNIQNCADRYEHGKNKLIPFCDNNHH